MLVRIVADSTCDLSEELVKKYNITILPLHIILGDKEYCDGVELSNEDIFRWSDANKATPKTSAPSIEDVSKVFKEILDEGCEIVALSIASGMSASNNVMRLSAQDLEAEDRISVIDSANLSTGLGNLVVEAAIMAQEGKNSREIVEYIENLKPYVRTSFVVDTLIYLHRGGRCSGLAAMAGGMLKLHPRINVVNGVMGSSKKYRGKIDSVIEAYAREMGPELFNAKSDRVFITHSNCSDELVNKVKDYLENLKIFNEVLVTTVGGVVSCHCGPGTLGILYIENPHK